MPKQYEVEKIGQGFASSSSSYAYILYDFISRRAYLILKSFTMCQRQNITSFIQKIEKITQQQNDSLEKAVALEALDIESPENTISFFEDLLQHGCISGMVSSLIYYCDTEAFFDKHYEEIISLKTEFEESTGQPMNIPHQLKNYLAWFSFEETARKLWKAE